MTIPEMLGQSGVLTLLGMCVVFSFLIVLILFMKLTAFIVRSFGWDKEVEKDAVTQAAPAGAMQNEQVVAAIAAALAEKNKL